MKPSPQQGWKLFVKAWPRYLTRADLVEETMMMLGVLETFARLGSYWARLVLTFEEDSDATMVLTEEVDV